MLSPANFIVNDFGCDNANRERGENQLKFKKMKVLLFIMIICLNSFVSFGQSLNDKQLVKKTVESFVNDYNNGDFKNAPNYTTNEWVHINPGGGITRGRDAVLKEVRAIHQTMLKGVKITIDTLEIHFLTQSVAVVNAVHTSDTYITPEDGVKHENERQVKTYIVVKQNGKWLLTLDQNTIISNP